MHPELLNNSLFLKYYKQWQDDPYSIVFAPIAEYFLNYDMIDDALKICRHGLKEHPALVSGRIVLAKIHIKRGNWEEAEEELGLVLKIVPKNHIAKNLLEKISSASKEEPEIFIPPEEESEEMEEDKSWPVPTSLNTVTMANIYAAQGYIGKARTIYDSILTADPDNEAAKKGLESLEHTQ